MIASLAMVAALSAGPEGSLAEPVGTARFRSQDATRYSAGKAVSAAIQFTVRKGWHTYWLNPGDNGYGPTIKWKLPPGWKVSELFLPVPKRIGDKESPAFGYEGDLTALVHFAAPKTAKQPVTITGDLRWMACESACIPLSDTLKITLRPADATHPARTVTSGMAMLSSDSASAIILNNEIVLSVSVRARFGTPFDFFPLDAGVLDHGARPSVTLGKDGWTLSMPRSPYSSDTPKRLRGLLVSQSGSGIPVDVPISK